MKFDYSIRAKYYGGVSQKRDGIAVHYTGDEERCGSAKDTAEMFANPDRQASAHIVVDEGDTAYVCVPLDHIAFAVGGLLYKDSKGGRYYGEYGNVNTISVEMVSRKDANGRWYIPEKTIQNAIEVIKILQAEYGIDDDNVFRHYDVNGKPCPWPWTDEPPYNGEYLWQEFKARLRAAGSETGGDKAMRFIDISHWNGNIDFEAVRNEVDGVIMKISQGNNYRDDKFEEYYKKATAAGLKVGCYVFMAATSQAEAKAEANFALSCLKNKKMPLGIWLDVETDSIRTTSFAENCITELSIWKTAGFNVGIYANLNWYRNYLTNDLKLYPLWIARYGVNNGQPNPESKPEIEDMYMWQYTSKGTVRGVSGNVDISEVYQTFGNDTPNDIPSDNPAPVESFDPHIKYKVYAKGKGWLPEVLDETDYAGIRGIAITAFAAMVTEGSLKYRCHTMGGKWYPYVTGYDTGDYNNGYAGDKNTEIDAIEVYYYTPAGKLIKKAKYRVSPVGGNYYPPQYDNEKTNGQDGFAGIFGRSIDRIQISISD